MKPFVFLFSHSDEFHHQAQQHLARLWGTVNVTDVVSGPSLQGYMLCAGHSDQPLISTDASAITERRFNGPGCIVHSSDQASIVTDPLGLQTIYFAKINKITVCSNSTQAILSLFRLTPELDDTALSGWLAGQPVPELSLYRNVSVLPAGYALEISADSYSLKKYWDIDPAHAIRFTSEKEYAASFRSVFTHVVEEYIGDSSIVASQMSGGMDSTSVTAIALKWQRQHERKCIALSHYYRHDPKSDESALIEDMRTHLNIDDFIFQDVDREQYRDFLQLYPAHFDHPGVVLSPRYKDEMRALTAQNVTMLLTGNGGDEMCWGHASTYTQRLKQGEIGVIGEVKRACRETDLAFYPIAKSLFIKPLIPQWLINTAKRLKGETPGLISMPRWMTPKGRELASASYDFPNPFDGSKDPARYARYFALKTTTTFNSVRSYDAIASEFNIKVKHPFFDYRIAEHSFAVPPVQLIKGAYPKYMLRNAMTDLLPESVCWRKTKTTFDHHFANLVRENAESLRNCLAHPYLADRGLIDTTQVLKAFDDAVYNRNGGVHVDLLFVILTQRWLQTFHKL